MKAFLCGPHIYKFEEVIFELHYWCGPHPLKKDGSPKKKVGKRFYDLYDRFSALSDNEKVACHISGGCIIL